MKTTTHQSASITSYAGNIISFDTRFYDLVTVHQDTDRMISCVARTQAAADDLAATSRALGAHVRQDGKVLVVLF